MKSATAIFPGLALGGTMLKPRTGRGASDTAGFPAATLFRHGFAGRDVALRLLYGFRISIFFALFLVFFGQVIGTVIGSLQDIFPRALRHHQSALHRDPAVHSVFHVVIILAALMIPTFWTLLLDHVRVPDHDHVLHAHRNVPGEDGNFRGEISTAHRIGASSSATFWPNCLTLLVTFTPFAIVAAIFALTGLDYLGYGLPAPTPSWGELIDQALRRRNRDKLRADAGAVRRHHHHAGAGRVYRRVDPRSVRSRSSEV